jgi:peptidoglycan hydrolase-like protein with peptidoglycan-binding domain
LPLAIAAVGTVEKSGACKALADLGYWVGLIAGVYGKLTEQAVLACPGFEGLVRDGIYGHRAAAALRIYQIVFPSGCI